MAQMSGKLLFIRNQLLSQKIRKFSVSRQLYAYKVDNVLVIGSGLMGSGIAQCCAQSHDKFKSIVLQDVNEDQLKNAKTRMEQTLTKMKQKNASINVDEIVSKITFSNTMTPKSVENLLIIEAVPELLPLKQTLFKQLNDTYGNEKSVVFVTNTSSLSCKEIGKHMSSLERFAGLHFFSPVPLMKLVEIARLENETSDETVKALEEFVKNINKVSVLCKDTPGFIVNRLLIPYSMEAVAMVERGDATVKDIDTAMKLGAGYPMGPFELGDAVGLDITKSVCDGWTAKGYDFAKPSKLLNQMVNKGHLGRKTGKGFYDYKK